MKRMGMFLSAAAMLIFTAASGASASTTRDSGMGLSGHAWMIDGLQSYIYENPSYLPQFKNSVFFERTEDDGYLNSGGFIWSPVNGLTVALFSGTRVESGIWNSASDGTGLFYTGNYDPVTTYETTALDGSAVDFDNADSMEREGLDQQNFRLITAYDFGAAAVGLNFAYSSSWNGNDTVTDSNDSYLFSNAQYDVGLGGLYRISPVMDATLSVGSSFYVLDNSYELNSAAGNQKTSYKSDGAMDINVLAGYNLKIDSIQKLHVRAGYSYLNRSAAGSNLNTIIQENSSDTYARKGQRIRLGVSDELSPSDKVTIFAGIDSTITMFKNDYTPNDAITPDNNVNFYKSDLTSIELPVYIGMEVRPTDNFEARFGLSHVIYGNTSGDISGAVGGASYKYTVNSNSQSVTELSLGLSAIMYNIRLDWLVNVDLFTRGPDFMSGHSVNTNQNTDNDTPLAMSLAVSYSFDELLTGKSQK